MTAATLPPRTSSPSASGRRRPLRVPPWWRDAAGSLAWASMLVVVALWLQGGGLSSFGGAGEALTTTGRLTGLVASDLLLVQVLLMARIPLVERSYGQDELARRHRLVGFWSFHLLLAHVALITLGYAVTYHGASAPGVVAEFLSITLDYPGMLLALAGTLLLVLVVTTSIRAARRRLRYESWHLLHLYAYLGVGLALPHQLWTGADFVANPLATVYWWGLWGTAAAAVLIFRIGLPAYRTLRHRVVVDGVVRESPDVVSVHLRGRDLHRLAAAGQFVTWRFLDGRGWSRGHPYSLSAVPTENRMRITVKDLGDGSGGLARLQPGTRAVVEGGYGRMHGGVRTRRKVTLLASGIGITPLRALLEDLPHAPGELTLVYRAREAADLVLRAEIDTIAARTGARVFYVLGRRTPGRAGWLPESAAHLGDAEALLRLVPDIGEHDVFVCGASGWMDAVRAAALEAGVPQENLHLERFAW